MAITRCIATINYFTGLPEDVVSNVFHFATVAEMTALEAAAVATRLDAFYTAIDAGLSPVLNANSLRYRFYHLSDPEPRVPFLDTVGAALTLGSSGLAEELAACISYQAEPASGEPQARRRGRIYIGPLSSSSVTGSTGGVFTVVSTAYRTTLANAAATLADQSETSQWAVYSTIDNLARQITNGWIDNAVDVQRRRGRRPTSRNVWTGVP